jgi:BolA protein
MLTQTIESKLRNAFQIHHLFLENQSQQHDVPSDSESHFYLLVVADEFEGLSRVQRHQAVYAVLAEELKTQIHALRLQTYTKQEFEQEGHSIMIASPQCARHHS